MIATITTPSFSRPATEPTPRAYALTFVLTHYPTQNRFALLPEMLEYTNSVQDRYSLIQRKQNLLRAEISSNKKRRDQPAAF
ncbi:hypothetical protein F9K78_12665 [Brucella pseudintermedia]|nr:hypothetical protein F9K78_12665 [Brucella pseudintermedia]